MERRDDVRFPARIQVEFLVLGGDSHPRPATIRDISEGGVRLVTDVHLQTGTFLRIDVDDSILYGEVRYCCRWMGAHVCGLYVERALFGKSDLSQLIRNTLPDEPQIQALPRASMPKA
jgi:hypothetical protein